MINRRASRALCAKPCATLLLSAALLFGQSSRAISGHRDSDGSGTPDGNSQLQDLPVYTPESQVSGVIRNFGNNYIPELMSRWEEGFQKYHPGVKFETSLPGSEAAMAGLYGGIADLAFIGRENYESEIRAFAQVTGYPPLGIQISSGSFMTPHKTFALMVFVHKDNPIAKASIDQLALIFGCPHNNTGTKIRYWGQLGLKGTWSHRRIHVYGYSPTTGMARYFQRTVLGGEPGWSDQLVDFDNGHKPNGEVINAGVYVLDALAKDPSGIAFANFLYAGPNVRAIALVAKGSPKNEAYSPTWENVFLRRYPLTRFTSVFINRPPGQAVNGPVREFLRYILSRDGMQSVADDGAYVPLNAKQIEIERRKLQ